MNRLGSRKKLAEEEPMPQPSIESESSVPSKMLGRTKRNVEEPKLEADIATALPPSDDFRTSLLMTGLSARFSILRERNDPTNELGKAGDDSVLYPKRQSRTDFGLSSDFRNIAKDSSMRSPPTKHECGVIKLAGVDAGESVMDRGKSTEDNSLFGGRQEVHKIPAAGGYGRALYNDDVAQSAFQRWRQPKKERTSFEEDQSNDGFESELVRPDSPVDFNRRRETSSATTSGQRNSTAATPIAFQPAFSLENSQPLSARPSPFPERRLTRTRRLYEQSLNERMQEHYSSVRSRTDTLLRGRFNHHPPELPANAPSPTNVSATVTSLASKRDDRRPMLSKTSGPNLHSFSPLDSASARPSPPERYARFPNVEAKSNLTSPPLSPPISKTEKHPILSIRADDHGKDGQYDENQYAQRQRQMYQGRGTPTDSR